MSTSIIDGTVAEAEPGRRRGAVTVFKSIRFELADGSSRTVKKAVVKQEIADELVPGSAGRFYLFKAFDISGVHGVRKPDGRTIYAFPANNQKLFLVLGIINLLWVVTMVAVRGAVPLLGVALLVLAAVGWYFMGKGATEAKQQFDGDNGLTRPVAA
jgi:hypothetical protein